MSDYDAAFKAAGGGDAPSQDDYDTIMQKLMPTEKPARPASSAAAGYKESEKTRIWSDVPAEALGNIPKSAGKFVGGIYDAVTSPIKTASGVFDAAAGALRNSMPESIGGFIDKYDPTKPATDRAVKTADAIGTAYKDRYGSSEGFKDTLATDPVGFAADLSTVLGGGALLSSGKLSSTLANASRLTNPLSAISPITSIAKSVVSVPAKNILGIASGVGAENISQAFGAGLNKTPAFLDNINGRSSMTDVLDLAKQNVSNMGAQKSAAYRAGMVDIKKDKAILSFDGIDKALGNGIDSVTFKGQIKNASGADAMQKISQEVANWKSLNPSEFHTPEGLDALKQKIGAITEAIPFEEKTARMVASNVYNSIKTEISAQAPTYAKTMKDYSSATDQIKEIERALSLGKNASADTAMRKLQSLSRNNVNTNYGNRLDLARQLEFAGGNDLLPSIAGQAMNSWTPRGISGTLGIGATAGVAGAALNPAILGLLGLQSPKAMGLLSYGAGATLRPAQGLLNTFDKYSPKNKAELGLLSGQLGSQPYNK